MEKLVDALIIIKLVNKTGITDLVVLNKLLQEIKSKAAQPAEKLENVNGNN